MWDFIKRLFIWWDGETFGTWFFTRWKGEFVGEDEHGNKYYHTRDDKKRWVVYDGYADGSDVPPGWSGWLQYRSDASPADETYTARVWEKPHRPNMTGTPDAWRPPASLLSPQPKSAAKPAYEAWKPE
ncbi:MAG TPA: NADH:ubiquinone oxidoreductase subunit NDUFA12 [Rhizobiales bacterium]|nr:NADH:ubiquinone oxidoreductase subunit NDUFA12 [Hyphomicrobiales bacterium]